MMYYSTTLFIFLSVWKFMLHPAGAFTSITESSSGLVVSPSHQSLQRNRHQQRSSHHELLTPLTTFHSSSSFFNHDHYQQQQQHQQQHRSSTVLYNTRRSFLNDVVSTSTTAVSLFFNTAIMTGTLVPTIAAAATAEEEEQQQQQPDNLKTVQTPLYYILRVREATEQETRLIKSGKFKDVQRANVKLAVKFMVDNYRLNDNFIAASAFLTGDRRIKAGDIGQTVVQNLYTILEYFDASDVENIKVGSTGLGGKEVIVLNGLQAAKKGIDDFVSLFPKEDVVAVIARIEQENALNEKEFDKELNQGAGILNPKPNQ